MSPNYFKGLKGNLLFKLRTSLLKGQESKMDGTEMSQNVGKELSLAQKGAVLIYFVAEAWNLASQVLN
jgi:hypothetical protein